MTIRFVRLGGTTRKDLLKVPPYILDKLLAWVRRVEQAGIGEVRKIKGYHDEALQGRRKGQRSIRLSRSYRAVYEIQHDGLIKFISIEEVNKHVY